MMPVFEKFYDDLGEDDTIPPRSLQIIDEASKELIAEHGPGRISFQSHDGFDDRYFWIKVTLDTSANDGCTLTEQ